MNLNVKIGGIATPARARAEALVQIALARRVAAIEDAVRRTRARAALPAASSHRPQAPGDF